MHITVVHGAICDVYSLLFTDCSLTCCRRAKDLVQSNISVLHKAAAVLLEKENLDGDEFLKLLMESQAEQYLKSDEPSVQVPYKA